MILPRAISGGYVQDQGSVIAGASRGITVFAPATVNTEGAWVQLDASLDHDADAFLAMFSSGTGQLADSLLDIGVGVGGSEQAIVFDLLYSSLAESADHALIPLPIKAGTRIAARARSTGVNEGINVNLLTLQGSFYKGLGLGRATTYGAVTTDSGGTSIDPGATANAKGGWVEITASLTNPVHALLLCVGGQVNTVRSLAWWLLDIGTGVGGSESVVLPNVALFGSTAADMVKPAFVFFPCHLKAGQRLAARAQCTITDATDRLIDLVAIGFD